MSKTTSSRKLRMPTPTEDRRITAAAKSDPDAQPLSKAQLDAMVPFRLLRGRPKLEHPKVLVSLRYSSKVIDHFRGTGAGWQSRIDDVLCKYVDRNARSDRKSR